MIAARRSARWRWAIRVASSASERPNHRTSRKVLASSGDDAQYCAAEVIWSYNDVPPAPGSDEAQSLPMRRLLASAER